MLPVSLLGQRVVAAAAWVTRVRPAWPVVVVGLLVAGVVLDRLRLDMPPLVEAAVLVVLALLYVFPVLVTVVQSFRAGLRGDESAT